MVPLILARIRGYFVHLWSRIVQPMLTPSVAGKVTRTHLSLRRQEFGSGEMEDGAMSTSTEATALATTLLQPKTAKQLLRHHASYHESLRHTSSWLSWTIDGQRSKTWKVFVVPFSASRGTKQCNQKRIFCQLFMRKKNLVNILFRASS